MKPILQIQFNDAQDAHSFLSYAARAKEADGTVTSIYAGLMSSALKRATVFPRASAPADVALAEALADCITEPQWARAADYEKRLDTINTIARAALATWHGFKAPAGTGRGQA